MKKFVRLACRSGLLFLLNSCATISTIDKKQDFTRAMQILEMEMSGKFGISALKLKSGETLEFRSGERFAMCSTFKLMVAASALDKGRSDKNLLSKHIRYSEDEVKRAGWAPVTTQNLAKGMSVFDLCAATLQQSDNAAANFIMKELGGLVAVNSFARGLGDKDFRLDRWEPELNSAIPGDPRDSSTPRAARESLSKLVFGDGLPKAEQEQLITWIRGNKTGDARIRAGAPKGWIVGDKTGTCSYGTTNDIGVLWSPDGDAVVLVVYFTQHEPDALPKDKAVARATELVLKSLDK